jgi:hypothetical protein
MKNLYFFIFIIIVIVNARISSRYIQHVNMMRMSRKSKLPIHIVRNYEWNDVEHLHVKENEMHLI